MIVLEPTLIFVLKYLDGALETTNITYSKPKRGHA